MIGSAGFVHEDDGEGLGDHAEGVSGLLAQAWGEGEERPEVSGGTALLCRSQCVLESPAGALRQVEQRVEALQPLEQGRRLRGVLRCSCRLEPVRSPHPDVRFHRGSRPCLGSGRKRGQQNQALGRSRGGFSTKIHLKTDHDGHILAFHLTGGEKADAPHFRLLLDLGPDIRPRGAVGDKAYSSKANRQAARERGAVAVIPYKANEKDKPAFFAKLIYKGRARIEITVGKIKRFKRVALRCEKTARNFFSFVALTAGFILIKSVHTA
jgi:transposase